ncbi:Hypothetical protein ORPV_870 [Orpheovirus IHUMI-LCC2]|uniref:Uncharacterized protein n=1 Tax=Orpheovirus IHUMI-LCC2 TaxID=2023057 RepID=A0A2I2L5G6_9VIRU|nr:Hypothetical protein ORPV_870 [Orpheovirus IHUMI-LCC2]SNW62774.1 Hypothetical protein ORPV_870 [Orpheovirus IHUMI-LCC2]
MNTSHIQFLISEIYNVTNTINKRIQAFDILYSLYDSEYSFNVMLYIIRKSNEDLFADELRRAIVNKYLYNLLTPSRSQHLINMIDNWDNRHLKFDELAQYVLSKCQNLTH